MRSVSPWLLALGLSSLLCPGRTAAAPLPEATAGADAVTVVRCLESFESNSVPPPGWIRLSQNAAYTWKISTMGTPHGGAYAADIEYDPALAPQDEWLLSPKGRYSGMLNFWSHGSIYWCRDTYDNCHLEAWLVQGPGVADGDDLLLGEAETAWVTNWTWAESSYSIDSATPNGLFSLAFRYTGIDGAQVSLDDISYDTPCAVFGADFEGESLAEWSTSQP